MALSVSEYRDLTAKILARATNGAGGRVLEDPLYADICEGRDSKYVGPNGETYSSCGDLPQWLWQKLGISAPWLNRTPHYRVGYNIARINEIAEPASLKDRYECGDTLLIWRKENTTDAHALVVLYHDHNGRVLASADAGQAHGKNPCARICQRSRTITRAPFQDDRVPHLIRDYWALDGRAIRCVVRLESVLERAEKEGVLSDIDGAAVLAGLE